MPTGDKGSSRTRGQKANLQQNQGKDVEAGGSQEQVVSEAKTRRKRGPRLGAERAIDYYGFFCKVRTRHHTITRVDRPRPYNITRFPMAHN